MVQTATTSTVTCQNGSSTRFPSRPGRITTRKARHHHQLDAAQETRQRPVEQAPHRFEEADGDQVEEGVLDFLEEQKVVGQGVFPLGLEEAVGAEADRQAGQQPDRAPSLADAIEPDQAEHQHQVGAGEEKGRQLGQQQLAGQLLDRTGEEGPSTGPPIRERVAGAFSTRSASTRLPSAASALPGTG